MAGIAYEGGYSASTSVEAAFAILFEAFDLRSRPETQWVERVLDGTLRSDREISEAIEVAIAMHCPNVPDERVPEVAALLLEAARQARSDRMTPAQRNR